MWNDFPPTLIWVIFLLQKDSTCFVISPLWSSYAQVFQRALLSCALYFVIKIRTLNKILVDLEGSGISYFINEHQIQYHFMSYGQYWPFSVWSRVSPYTKLAKNATNDISIHGFHNITRQKTLVICIPTSYSCTANIFKVFFTVF